MLRPAKQKASDQSLPLQKEDKELHENDNHPCI